jgi:choline-sulfatase
MVPGIKFDPQTDPNVTGPQHLALAERILSDPNNVSGQFFAWFHFMDPHDVYMLHQEVEPWGSSGRDRYDAEVQFTDIQIGKLLEFVAAQPWASRTAIIVSSDHGEAFGEHGVYRHGFELIQELVRVPWFFSIPNVAPRRIDVPRSHVDMAATILELMGVEQGDKPVRGQSLVAEIMGRETPQPRDIVVDLPRTSDNDRRRALISGHHKIIGYADDAYFRLYDLDADPGEQHDLRKSEPETFARLAQQYREVSKGIHEEKPYACRALKGAPEGRDF